MTSPTVGAFSGLSHAELVAAYQACRERVTALEYALTRMIHYATTDSIKDMDKFTAALHDARAILAKEPTP